jgi:hypothetical protein
MLPDQRVISWIRDEPPDCREWQIENARLGLYDPEKGAAERSGAMFE